MNISALRYSDFRIYFIGNMFALNGLWMQRLTIGWIAWSLTNSASFVGFIAFLNFAPTMIAGPLFGVLIDRVNVKHAALVTQLSMLFLAVLLILSFRLELLNSTVLAVMAFALGIVASAHNPIRMSLAPRLVDREAVPSVVALVAINFHLARLTGPALGGWIIAVWGVGTSLFIQALCYLPFILAISFLHPRERKRPSSDSATFLAELGDGIRYAISDIQIRQAIMATGIFAFVLRGTMEILPVIADGVFNKGPTGLGLLTSSAGLGAVIAGMFKALAPSQSDGRLPRKPLFLALVGIGAVAVLGNSTSWELSLILIAWLGFTASISGISMQTAIQINLDDELRGRVMSLWAMVGIGAAAAGAALLGLFVDLIGLSPTFTLAAGFGVILLGGLILRIK